MIFGLPTFEARRILSEIFQPKCWCLSHFKEHYPCSCMVLHCEEEEEEEEERGQNLWCQQHPLSTIWFSPISHCILREQTGNNGKDSETPVLLWHDFFLLWTQVTGPIRTGLVLWHHPLSPKSLNESSFHAPSGLISALASAVRAAPQLWGRSSVCYTEPQHPSWPWPGFRASAHTPFFLNAVICNTRLWWYLLLKV